MFLRVGCVYVNVHACGRGCGFLHECVRAHIDYSPSSHMHSITQTGNRTLKYIFKCDFLKHNYF